MLLLLCIKIFFARITDVSLGTVRTILTIKGKSKIASITGFCEVIIWFLVVKEALNTDMTSFWIPISYAAGFASGTYIGSFLSDTFIKGTLSVRIVTSHKDEALIDSLRKNGYGASIMEINSHDKESEKYMIFTDINKKKLSDLKALVKKIDKNAFMVVDETKSVQNGYFK